MAILTDTADSRKQCRKSTFVRVQQDGKREAQTKKEAQAVADGYEAVYRGRILYTKQAEIFRAAAGETAEEQKACSIKKMGTPPSQARKIGTNSGAPSIFTPSLESYCEDMPRV